jgi:amino-acid N-acetyltransferase
MGVQTMSSTHEDSISIGPARAQDPESIAALLVPYVELKIVLPRSAADIRQHLPNFLVARLNDSEVIGSVALRDFSDGLHEIRSLVVRHDHSGRGIGSKLIKAAIAMAQERQAKRIFTLTVRPHLFLRLGFVVAPMADFPEKVWSDCRACPKRDCCDEVALVLPMPPTES